MPPSSTAHDTQSWLISGTFITNDRNIANTGEKENLSNTHTQQFTPQWAVEGNSWASGTTGTRD